MLQVFGFIGCAVGLFLASLSAYFTDGQELLLIFAFTLFNFMTNLGPNAQTYLLAGEVFPTAIRGKGAGFAAAFAKIAKTHPGVTIAVAATDWVQGSSRRFPAQSRLALPTPTCRTPTSDAIPRSSMW
jgi:hypothetical protein